MGKLLLYDRDGVLPLKSRTRILGIQQVRVFIVLSYTKDLKCRFEPPGVFRSTDGQSVTPSKLERLMKIY